MPAKILLVEDESITRISIADCLRNDGYEVKEAGDGAEAVRLFESQRFDLVITDFVMPQMDGFKLITRVRSISPETPIILITAYLSKDTGKAILQESAGFIEKPVKPEVLLPTVRQLLPERN